MHLKKSQNKILEEMNILEEQLQEDILPNLSKPDKIRLLNKFHEEIGIERVNELDEDLFMSCVFLLAECLHNNDYICDELKSKKYHRWEHKHNKLFQQCYEMETAMYYQS